MYTYIAILYDSYFHEQIQSIGEFESTSSNWSDPFFIPIEDGYTAGDCIFVGSEVLCTLLQPSLSQINNVQ